MSGAPDNILPKYSRDTAASAAAAYMANGNECILLMSEPAAPSIEKRRQRDIATQ